MSKPLITVIVPTYNRLPALQLCLHALEQQSLAAFSVIIVNDGATDGTREFLASYQQTTSLQLVVLEQKNAGPASARNYGLSMATTEITLLIGDDILASPTLLETHLHFHLQQTHQDWLAVGLTRWDTEHQSLTPFMQWYERIQFGYDQLFAGASPDWRYAYTSNLSFKTRLLREHPFDERFRNAAWEDNELAYRLERNGRFHLEFLPAAIATHVHPTTFLQANRRSRVVGQMERLFHEIHPEVRQQRKRTLSETLCCFLGRHDWLLRTMTAAVDRFNRPGKLHGVVLRSHHLRGYYAMNGGNDAN